MLQLNLKHSNRGVKRNKVINYLLCSQYKTMKKNG